MMSWWIGGWESVWMDKKRASWWIGGWESVWMDKLVDDWVGVYVGWSIDGWMGG